MVDTLVVKQYQFFGWNTGTFPKTLKDTNTTSTSTTFATLYDDDSGSIKVEVKGTGFKYLNGKLVGGLITSATVLQSDGVTFNKTLELSGVTLDVAKVYADPNYNPFPLAALNYDSRLVAPDNYGYGVTVNGSAYNDVIRGGAGSDTFRGQSGNDVLLGGGGADFLYGGGGADRLFGEDGDDYLSAAAGKAAFDGGAGSDSIFYSGAPVGLVADLTNFTLNRGMAKGHSYVGIENLSGANNDDKFVGNGEKNTLIGWGGVDTLFGGDNDDILVGGAGADKLLGDAGSDTVAYSTVLSGGQVAIEPSDGKGVIASLADPTKNTGDAKGDRYASIENLTGTKYVDELYGDKNANVLTGLDGADILGGAAGNDTLYGGLAADKLTGGLGADKLYGEAGADQFIYLALTDSTNAVAGRDTIFDFSQAELDKIDLFAIDANTAVANDQGFSFIGAKAFTKVAGQLRAVREASDTYVSGDVNGDGVADFTIHLDDAVTLLKTDFVL